MLFTEEKLLSKDMKYPNLVEQVEVSLASCSCRVADNTEVHCNLPCDLYSTQPLALSPLDIKLVTTHTGLLSIEKQFVLL